MTRFHQMPGVNIDVVPTVGVQFGVEDEEDIHASGRLPAAEETLLRAGTSGKTFGGCPPNLRDTGRWVFIRVLSQFRKQCTPVLAAMTNLPKAPPGFDDSNYLNRHPDVHTAVGCGEFGSGWEHYLKHGFLENREAVAEEVRREVIGMAEFSAEDDGLPPAFLRRRVHGCNEAGAFRLVGEKVAESIKIELERESIFLDKTSRLLDFGCGCGRVLRYLPGEIGACQLFGTDVDAEAIRWCRTHLGDVAQFFVNQSSPPSPFEDNFFDLVLSVSIFTHLPETMQFDWLAELSRITRPGGHLFLSVRNEDVVPVEAAALHDFRARGFGFEENIIGEELPEYYHTAYHTAAYVRREWGRYFTVRSFVPDGVYGQALVVGEK